MSDFLKKMKGLFVIEDETPATQANNNPPTAKPASEAPANDPPQAVSSTVSAGQVNDKFTEILFGALQQNNMEGFDYLEFKQSIQSLSKMPMDDATRMQSAFAMAQTMGVTADKLMTSAQHYVGVLQTEQKKFQEALSKQRSAQIGNREEQITQLDQTIKSKTEQIQKLTQEIQQHQQQMGQLKQEIQQSTVKVESTKNDFEASFQYVVGQIQKDMQQMKAYLK